MSSWQVIQGDCLDVLRGMAANSIDAVVSDPPYGLSFMGKRWDYDVPGVDVWAECLRVLKPGGHLLAFAGTRTQHRMCVRIEDAGFEIRDMIAWVYSTGFPKSHNLGCKCRGSAIPYTHEVPRESTPERNLCAVRDEDVSASMDTCEGRRQVLQPRVPEQSASGTGEAWTNSEHDGRTQSGVEGRSDVSETKGQLQTGAICSLPFASGDDGANGRVRDGTSVSGGKRARKAASSDGVRSPHQSRPIGQSFGESGTVRVESGPQVVRVVGNTNADLERCAKCGELLKWSGWGTALKPALEPITLARKPLVGTVAANVQEWGTGAINVNGCRVDIADGDGWDVLAPDTRKINPARSSDANGTASCGRRDGMRHTPPGGRWPANLIHDGSDEVVAGFPGEADESAARFFYVPKASKADREAGMEGAEPIHRVNGNKWTDQDYRVTRGERPPSAESGPRCNHHPTVKPTDLMRYLCRLVTPPGGTVLDPFTGSGSTGRGAILEGFNFVGVEREAEYVEIARKRIGHEAANHLYQGTP